ncbi:MAG: hypothetical protein IJA32_07490 [Lachnospiraceae bacterium]|nr:hypothetical protein [Lachnospiraceae bacterium]
MRTLDINDVCYKFFYSDEECARRNDSRVYKKGEVYPDSKGLFFSEKMKLFILLKI